ncbi:MAG: NUDIX domain-containing protein [Ruminiclostridium sp.]|nr:NUDIX domain-containing protein [Ruminiclostridium sp.]
MKEQEYICEDYDGNIFLSFYNIAEDKIYQMPEFTHCLAVVKVGGEYILGWNKWRNRYEIFGGCIENGESARDGIIRELEEELGIDKSGIRYLGAMKFLMKPDYFSPNERIELGGLYGITLPETSLDELYRQVKDKDELTKLAFYSQIKGKEPIAVIDDTQRYYYAEDNLNEDTIL